VKVPALSSTSNTILYMYYGNGSCSNQQDVVNVWTGYVGVWHLSESSGSGYYIKNSAQNNYHANANSTTYLSSSIIDGGRDFNNSYSDVQNGSGLFGGNTAFALELWGYPDYATDADWYEESYLMSDSLNLCRWRHDSGAPAGRGTLQCDVHWTGGAVDYFTSVNDALTRQAWNHIVLTYDGANLKWYVNGSQNSQLSRASASLLANTYAMLGNNGGIDSNFDEYRYSSVVRSSGWILTEYNNQSSPSVFYAIGGQTTASSNVQIVVTVSHTAPDGSGATTIVTSSTTTINSSTANPYALSIGSGAQQTFTSGNPRRLRAQINVSAVNGSEGFVLAYDGSCASTQCSNLDTPVVTVPEPGLGLIGIAATLPGLAAAIRRRKKRRTLYRRVQAGGVS
jgi:hypothetical protein